MKVNCVKCGKEDKEVNMNTLTESEGQATEYLCFECEKLERGTVNPSPSPAGEGDIWR